MESRDQTARVHRIAVLRPNHRLGNTLLLTPLVQELEARFPSAEIELVVAGTAADAVFERFARVTAIHSFPTTSYGHPARVLRILRGLKERNYDLAIDPIPQSRSGRFLLNFLHARDRVGFRWGVPSRDRALTHSADPGLAPSHFAQAPVYLMRSAYFRTDARTAAAGSGTQPLDLRLTASERREGERCLAKALGSAEGRARPRVGIFAHATGEKCYPVAWWRQIVAYLRNQQSRAQLLEFVPADGRPRLAGEIPALHMRNLRTLGATLAATSLVVIADGGVMHLADAAGARVLGLFKTTEPARYGPSRSMSEGLLARNVSAEYVAARISAEL